MDIKTGKKIIDFILDPMNPYINPQKNAGIITKLEVY